MACLCSAQQHPGILVAKDQVFSHKESLHIWRGGGVFVFVFVFVCVCVCVCV